MKEGGKWRTGKLGEVGLKKRPESAGGRVSGDLEVLARCRDQASNYKSRCGKV